MSIQADMKPWWLHVRFEQGRGLGGVPKITVAYYAAGDTKPAMITLVRAAVGQMRALSLDPHMGHGADLMPGRDEEYMLHNVDGGALSKPDDIRWETREGLQHAELVLTWQVPNVRLLNQLREAHARGD